MTLHNILRKIGIDEYQNTTSVDREVPEHDEVQQGAWRAEGQLMDLEPRA